MTYAVNFETTPRVIAVKLSTGGMMHASFGSVQYVNTGKQGIGGPQGAPGSDADILPITNLELEKLLI